MIVPFDTSKENPMAPAFDPAAQDHAIRRWKRGVLGFMSSTAGGVVGTGFVLELEPGNPLFLGGVIAVAAFQIAAAVSVVYIAIGGVDMDIQAERRDRLHGIH